MLSPLCCGSRPDPAALATSFPRRAARHVEPQRRELSQHLLMEKPFQGLPSEPPGRAKADPRVTHQPEVLSKRSRGSINSSLGISEGIHILQPIQGQRCILSTPNILHAHECMCVHMHTHTMHTHGCISPPALLKSLD